jgi:hypothetical protein
VTAWDGYRGLAGVSQAGWDGAGREGAS